MWGRGSPCRLVWQVESPAPAALSATNDLPPTDSSNVEVQSELIRVRTQLHRLELLLALVLDPGFDQVLGENSALEQKLVVAFERVQDFLQTSGRGLYLGLLVGLELIQVLVNRLGRDQLLLDAVQPRQQHRAHGEIRVRRRVGTAELDALGFLAFRVDRNADTGAAVALRIDQVDGRLIPRHEAAVRIRGGSAEGQQRGRVRQNASDVVNRGFAQVRIPVLLVEEVLAVVPKALVDVHAGAVVLEDGLGHEGDSLAVAAGDVLGDV